MISPPYATVSPPSFNLGILSKLFSRSLYSGPIATGVELGIGAGHIEHNFSTQAAAPETKKCWTGLLENTAWSNLARCENVASRNIVSPENVVPLKYARSENSVETKIANENF